MPGRDSWICLRIKKTSLSRAKRDNCLTEALRGRCACRSFRAEPVGWRSPRSHWLTVLTATFMNAASTAWLTFAFSRTFTISAVEAPTDQGNKRARYRTVALQRSSLVLAFTYLHTGCHLAVTSTGSR